MPITQLISHPLAALFITIGSFLCAQRLQKQCHGNSLLNPVVIAIIIVTLYIVIFDLSYHTYLQNVSLIHDLLGPATVALAVPLYKQLPTIKRSLVAIILSVLIASIVAAAIGYIIANAMGAATDIKLAIMPKSTTTAIAIGIAEKINTNISLAVFFVFTTGIIGTIIATSIFRTCKITSDKAIGLSLGVTCHGLGVARAFQYSETAGIFAAIGMSLMGIISGITIPFVVLNLLN